MKSELQVINQRLVKYTRDGNTTLSFVHFFEHIKRQAASERTVKRYIFQHIIEQFEKNPGWLQDISAATASDYRFLYELVYAAIVPAIVDEHSYLWGLGMPVSPTIFYATDAFYSLLQRRLNSEIPDSLRYSEEARLDHWHYTFVYSLVLREIYHFPVLPHDEFTYSYVEEETGLLKYLTLKSDQQFVKVRSVNESPRLNIKMISGAMDRHDVEYLLEHLPLHHFSFEGFSVLTVSDSTALNILENIRNTVVEQNPRDLVSTYEEALTLMKSMIGNVNVNFGILPLMEINHHLVVPYSSIPFSFLVKTSRDLNIPEEVFLEYYRKYRTDPKLYFYRASDERDELSPFAKIFHQTRIDTLALIPVFHNNNLVGLLEAHSYEASALNESSLALLEHVLPLLAQLLQKNIHDFNSYIDYKIKTSFTSIQPSVEWKFREAIWNNMKELKFDRRKLSVPTVSFSHVYPMYGAIDIRNSTVERNKALQADLLVQVQALIAALLIIEEGTSLLKASQLLVSSKRWFDKIEKYLLTSDEIEFNDFLIKEVQPFFHSVQDEFPSVAYAVTAFSEVSDPKTGSAFRTRRALEASIHKITTEVSNHIDLFRKQIQRIYPFYFEKFRTDGVEYDIYVGQSIAPEKVFEYSYLRDFRMMQLRSMVEVVKLTQSLLPDLPTPLYTTQLIFINPSPIDISFRNDERRFDVEGAYNIRYQVIKKRIDKVNIRGTNERLTQPGKIAMVYYNSLEAEEYRKYIHQLQTDEVLEHEMEELELEELQGISGLRAIRVGVKVAEAVLVK